MRAHPEHRQYQNKFTWGLHHLLATQIENREDMRKKKDWWITDAVAKQEVERFKLSQHEDANEHDDNTGEMTKLANIVPAEPTLTPKNIVQLPPTGGLSLLRKVKEHSLTANASIDMVNTVASLQSQLTSENTGPTRPVRLANTTKLLKTLL